MKHKRLHKERADANGVTRWIQPVRRGYLMACCDCNLCHWMDFRIHGGRVQFRMRRAPRYTARIRAKERDK